MASADDSISTDSQLLNVKEKVDFLFKNYLGFPNTKQGLPYFNEEAAGTSNNYIDGADVLINPLPEGTSLSFTKIWDKDTTNNADLLEKINLPNTITDDNNTTVEVYEDSTGIVLEYVNVPLTAVPNTTISTGSGDVTQTYFIPGRAADGSADATKNVLHDTIQTNVEQYYDSNESLIQPYGYSLRDSGGTPIKAGKFGGNFIVDVKNGIVNFTDVESNLADGASGTIHSRLNAGVPNITFKKYNGLKGIASVIQASSDGTNTFSDVSANNIQSNRQAIGALFSEMQDGILLDLCGQRFHDDNKGSAIILPKGENAQRPWVNGYNGGTGDGAAYRKDNAEGALRYNTETKQFEGYSSEAWQGLGGVTDIAQKTKVTASFSSDDSGQDKRLRFFVDGSLNMVFDGSGNIAMGYNYDGADQTLQGTGFSGTDVSFNDNVNVTIHADMSMNGMFYNTGGMDIDAGVSLTGNLTQVGDIDLTGDITQTGDVSQTGTLTVSGDTKINNKFNVDAGTGNLDMSGNLTVHGTSALNDNVTIADDKNLTMGGSGAFTTGDGDVGLNGNVTIADAKHLAMTGAGEFTTGTGAVALKGDTTIDGSKTFTVGTGASNLGGSLTVTGTTTLNDNVSINTGKNLTMGNGAGEFTTGTGAVALNGNTTIDGSKTFTVGTGASNLGGSLAVTGITTLNGNTSITGAKTFTVGSGAVNLGTGTVAIGGNVTIATGKNILMQGASTLTTGTGVTTIKGTTTAEDVVSISKDIDASGTTDGALVVSGGVGIAKKLFVGGNTKLTGDFEVNDNFRVTASNGNTELDGTLKVMNGGNDRFSVATDGSFSAGSDGAKFKVSSSGQTEIEDTTGSSTTATGSLIVKGGVGIAENINVGGTTSLEDNVTITADKKFLVGLDNKPQLVVNASPTDNIGDSTYSGHVNIHNDYNMTVKTQALTVNNRTVATTEFVHGKIEALIAGAPGTLDTLNEIAQVLGDPATDPSGNSALSILRKVHDISENVGALNVNANMQKLFEIQTQQPGKFNETDHDEKSGAITLKWSYNDIRATHETVKATLGLRAHMTNANDTKAEGNPVTSSASVSDVSDPTNNYGIKASKLPYIHELHFDISGVPQLAAAVDLSASELGYTALGSQAVWDASRSAVMDGDSGKWVPLTGVSTVQLEGGEMRLDEDGNLVLANNEDYDTQKFRKLIVGKVNPSSRASSVLHNILGRANTAEDNYHNFDIRVYGTNFSENFPDVESRCLIFKDLSFAGANAPSVDTTSDATATEEIVANKHNLNLSNIKIDKSEASVSNSTAKVIEVKYTYEENASRRSASVSASSEKTEIDVVSGSNQDGATIQDAEINDLSGGVQYKINAISMKNDINPNFGTAITNSGSGYVATKYTDVFKSHSNAKATDSNIISVSLASATNNILNPESASTTAYGTNHVYLKTTSNNLLLNFASTGRTIEVSKESSSDIDGNTAGNFAANLLGVGLDDETDIVKVNIDFSRKGSSLSNTDIVKLHGFDTTTPAANATIKAADVESNYCDAITPVDPYENTNNRGFRIEADIPLKSTITAAMLDTASVTVDASVNILKYTLERHDDQGAGADPTDEVHFFRDNLTVDPTVTLDGDNGIFVNEFVRVAGIPIASKVNITLKATFGNLCSDQKLVKSDRIIGSFSTAFNGDLTNFGVTDDTVSRNYMFINYGDVAASKEKTLSFTGSTISNSYRSYSTNNNNGATGNINVGDGTVPHRVTAKNLNSDTLSAQQDLCSNFLILDKTLPASTYYYFKDSKAPSDTAPSTDLIGGTIASNSANIEQWPQNTTTDIDWSTASFKNKVALWLNGQFRSNTGFKYPNVTTYRWDINIAGDNHGDIGTTDEYSYDSTYNGYRWMVHAFTTPGSGSTTLNLKSVVEDMLGSGAVNSFNLFDEDGGDGIAYIVYQRGTNTRIGWCGGNASLDNWYKTDAATSFADLRDATKNLGCGPLTAIPFPDEDNSNGKPGYLVIGIKDDYSK